MAKFSLRSINKLSTCHPDIQVLFSEVIKYYDCIILEGHRDEAAQEAAFAAGHSKLHYPNGKHNSLPSCAVDCAPYPVDWKDSQRFHFFAGFVLGIANEFYQQGVMAHKIRWGGAWRGLEKLNSPTILNDYVHFELILA